MTMVKSFSLLNYWIFMLIMVRCQKQIVLTHLSKMEWSKRKHNYILNIARVIRFQAYLLIGLWNACVLTEAYLINRLLSKVIQNHSPLKFYLVASLIMIIYVFLVVCYMLKILLKQKNLVLVVELGFLLGIQLYKKVIKLLISIARRFIPLVMFFFFFFFKDIFPFLQSCLALPKLPSASQKNCSIFYDFPTNFSSTTTAVSLPLTDSSSPLSRPDLPSCLPVSSFTMLMSPPLADCPNNYGIRSAPPSFSSKLSTGASFRPLQFFLHQHRLLSLHQSKLFAGIPVTISDLLVIGRTLKLV